MTDRPATPSPARAPPKIAMVIFALLQDEIAHLGRGLDHIVHVDKLRQGLHDDPEELDRQLQAAIDGIEARTDADAIVLGTSRIRIFVVLCVKQEASS